jgi:hypothetical protein
MFGAPQSALAACAVGTAPNTVDCATTTTTNTTATDTANAASVDRHQLFTAGGAVSSVTATVGAGATVNGFGLAITNTQAGALGNVTVLNSGTVTLTAGVPSAGGTAAFNITTTNGGAINYSGAGNVNDGGQGTTALQMSSTGTAGGITATVGGTISVTGATGDGINATITNAANAANIGLTTNGSVTGVTTGVLATTVGGGTVTVAASNNVTATAGNGIQTSAVGGLNTVSVTAGTIQATGNGINATSTGAGGVTVNMAGGQVGTSAATRVGGAGIVATSTGAAGNIGVTGTTIFSTGNGITASIANASSGNIVVQGNGAINTSAGNGINATITNAASTGSIQVTTGAAGTLVGTAGHTGINALQSGLGAVTVTVGAAIDPFDVGASSVINNAANANNATLHVNAPIDANLIGARASTTGTGNVVVDGTGTIGATTAPSQFGITAVHSGPTGSVSVASGNVTAAGAGSVGINAQITAAGNNSAVTVGGAAGAIGAVSGATGINATTAGNGTVTVTAAANVTGTAGNGIQTTTFNGLNTVNVTTGTIQATINGINATSSGTGGVTVNMTGGQVGTSTVTQVGGAGIVATSSGTAGNVNVTSTPIFSTGNGITASITGASTGNIVVQSNGAINTSAGNGIDATVTNAASNGSIGITTAGKLTGTAGHTGINAVQSGLGALTATVGGAIDPFDVGANMQINNAANASNVTLHVNAPIDANLIGARATTNGTGNVVVDGTGTIGATTAPSQFGITAVHSGANPNAGNVSVASGNVRAAGVGSVGINAQITGVSTGNVTVGGAAGAIGVVSGATGINATTVGNGTVTVTTANNVTGTAGNGIQTTTVGGTNTVNVTAGAIQATGNGINATSTTGSIFLGGGGNITAGGDGVNATTAGPTISVGITGFVHGGPVGINATGANFVGVSGWSDASGGTGINAVGGTVTVGAGGTVEGATANGINATAGAGNSTVTGVSVVTAAAIGINATSAAGNVLVSGNGAVTGATGINASTPGNGSVTVTNTAAVTSTAGNAIQATGVNGPVTVNGQAAISATGGSGINAQSSGTGGITITTTAAGTVNATAVGILAQTSGAAGNVSVTTAGVIGGVGTPPNRGIEGDILLAANAGTVALHANADVFATGVGVFGFSAGTGSVTADGSGNVTGGSFGVFATQTNNAVGTNAGVHVGGTGAAVGAGGAGVSATVTGANNAGNVLVDRSGTILGSTDGVAASTAGAGTVTVTTGANVTGTAGNGINTSATSGATAINVNAGTTQGGTAAVTAVATTTGDITITSAAGAAIQNLSGAFNSLVVSSTTTTGLNTLNNNGTMSGNVTMAGTGTQAIANAGTWNTLGTTNFSAAANSVGNTGTINVPGTALFSGGATNQLVNSGVINLSGPTSAAASNNLTSTGKFTANGGFVNVSYDLSQPAGRSGTLTSNNGNTGNTVVNFNNVGGPVTIGPNTHVIINSAGAGNLNATAGSGLPSSFGLVNVALVPVGNGNWDLQRTANAGAIGAPAGSIVAAITAFDTSFHQVASAFVASPQSQEPNKLTGGVWSRGSAGQVTAKSTVSTDSVGVSPVGLKVRTNFEAYQVGIDGGILNAGGTGWNIHGGIMAGNVGANSSEQLGTGTSLKFDVPFAGFYGVFTHGAFFSDVSVRRDWHHDNVTNQTANLANASLTGTSDAVNASAGYHIDLKGFFVEPSVGVGITKTSIDPLATPAVNGSATGTIGFQTLNSEMVRAGLRVGTSATIRDVLAVQPFATVSVWRELSGSAQDQFTQGATQNFSLTRVGTFYQVGAGLGAQVLKTGILGFIRGDVRFGDNLDGASVVAGGRYTFAP